MKRASRSRWSRWLRRSCWSCATAAAVFALVGISGCKGKSGPYDPCVATPDCSGGRACFELESGAGICLATCEARAALCDGGEACARVTASESAWACLPGGDLDPGDTCTRSIDCERGALCVEEGSVSVCRAACDPTGSDCSSGSVCEPLDETRDETRGVCRATSGDAGTADVGDAGG